MPELAVEPTPGTQPATSDVPHCWIDALRRILDLAQSAGEHRVPF